MRLGLVQVGGSSRRVSTRHKTFNYTNDERESLRQGMLNTALRKVQISGNKEISAAYRADVVRCMANRSKGGLQVPEVVDEQLMDTTIMDNSACIPVIREQGEDDAQD